MAENTEAKQFLGLAIQAALDAAFQQGASAEDIENELKDTIPYSRMFAPAGEVRRLAQLDEILIEDRLVTVIHVDEVPLTRKRLLMTYNQTGELIDPSKKDPEWYRTALAPFQRVYSVGKTPEAAIRALGRKVGWGRVKNIEPVETPEIDGWYCRFFASGVSMKAGGRHLPGGVILDWWK